MSYSKNASFQPVEYSAVNFGDGVTVKTYFIM